MQYGQMGGSNKLNKAIYHCFQYIDETEARKFVRKFQDQPHESVQVIHTYRELILGAFLGQNGFHVKHDYEIDLKTPDWCSFDDSSNLQYVVELASFHPDAATSQDIVRQIREKGIWGNFVKPNTERLYHAIAEKVLAYRALAKEHKFPYIVAIYGESFAAIKQEELDECLFGTEAGLFSRFPEFSGFLFFEESAGSYLFFYKPNPHAVRPMSLPSGRFEKHRGGA